MTKQLVDSETGEIIAPTPVGEEITGRRLLDILNKYAALRDEKTKLEREMAIIKQPIHAALERGEEVYDGETRLRAFLQQKTEPELDGIAMSEQRPDVLTWLANKGALKLHLPTWKALDGKAREVMLARDFISPKTSESLQVKGD